MENQMQVFNFKDQQVDIILIDGQPHFIGSQVSRILGYANPQKAVRDHVDEEDKRTERIVHPSGGMQDTVIINEGGLYSLIFSSNLKSSKEFKRWVTHEVLPSIRKTGKYENPQFNRKAGCTFRVGNVDGYFDENGKAFFNLEDTARALGMITSRQDANDNHYVHWSNVKKMLWRHKYIKPWQKLDREAFIPEDVFYSMVDQARNATAQEFQAIVKAEMPQKSIPIKQPKTTLYHLVKDIRCAAEEIEKTFNVSHLTAIDRAIELKEQMVGINLDVLRELLPVDDPVELN